ncbi:MAG TPA: hypothetical protein VFI30_03225 [Nocardioidaceae bacterium]|nr:hypothetical protein [Nocardioidaceae bacterium]
MVSRWSTRPVAAAALAVGGSVALAAGAAYALTPSHGTVPTLPSVAAAPAQLSTQTGHLPPMAGANNSADQSTGQPPQQAVGPDATGPAMFGLCTAVSHGGLSTHSVAYRNLAAAAGGDTQITTYCATATPGGKTTGSATTSHQPPTPNGIVPGTTGQGHRPTTTPGQHRGWTHTKR